MSQLSQRRRNLRERVLLRLPTAVIEWPFETMMSLYALITGAALTTGLVSSASVAALFPEWAARILGVLYLVGGLDVAWGLHRGAYTSACARGLRLLGGSIGAYTVSIIAFGGWRRSAVAALIIGGVALLCALRSFYLRGKGQMLARIATVAERS